jgi:hypothetical protein
MIWERDLITEIILEDIESVFAADLFQQGVCESCALRLGKMLMVDAMMASSSSFLVSIVCVTDRVNVLAFVNQFHFGESSGRVGFHGGLNPVETACIRKLTVDGFDGVFDVGVFWRHVEGETFAMRFEESRTFCFRIAMDARQGFLGNTTYTDQGTFVVGNVRYVVAPDGCAETVQDGGLGNAGTSLGQRSFPESDLVARPM